jgi:hypothetical protein
VVTELNPGAAQRLASATVDDNPIDIEQIAGSEDIAKATSLGSRNALPYFNNMHRSSFQRTSQPFKNDIVRTANDESDPDSFLLLCRDHGRDVNLANLDVSKKKCDNTFYHAINQQHHGALYKYWRFLNMRHIKTVEFVKVSRDMPQNR